MSYRYCVYKDCENYTVNKIPCGNRDFSMFQFPKDAERRQRWKELGDIHPCISEMELFYCSDHFEQKHMSQNPRRRYLIKEAMPIPHNEPTASTNILTSSNVETENTKTSAEQNTYFILEDSVVQGDVAQKVESNYQVESTMQEDEDGNLIEECAAIDYCGDDDYIDDDDHNLEEPSTSLEKMIALSPRTNTTNYNRKRKLESESAEKITPTKTQIVLNNIKTYANNQNLEKYIKIQAVKLPDNVKQTETEQSLLVHKIPHKPSHQQLAESIKVAHATDTKLDGNGVVMDENTLIDPKHVTTFIYKGEEYVQMTKKHYAHEKTALAEKIKAYESILSILKQQLNKLDCI